MDESLGPVAVSLRREKLEEDKEHGQQYNYRLIFRTSEVSLVWISLSASGRSEWAPLSDRLLSRAVAF